MITVGQLKDICEKLENEYGSDMGIVLRIYSDQFDHSPIKHINGWCLYASHTEAGELILSNRVPSDSE